LARQAQQQIGTALEAMQLSATLATRKYEPVQARQTRAGKEQHFQSLYCVLLYTTLTYEHQHKQGR